MKKAKISVTACGKIWFSITIKGFENDEFIPLINMPSENKFQVNKITEAIPPVIYPTNRINRPTFKLVKNRKINISQWLTFFLNSTNNSLWPIWGRS